MHAQLLVHSSCPCSHQCPTHAVMAAFATLQGPWMLSMVEVTTMLLLVLLSVRPTPRPWRFNFRTCLEDVVAASVVRAIIISAAYAYSSRRYFYRCASTAAALHCACSAASSGMVQPSQATAPAAAASELHCRQYGH